MEGTRYFKYSEHGIQVRILWLITKRF
jgi:hypothetical protein